MKKYYQFLLALVMSVFVLVGCGTDEAQKQEQTNEPNQAAEQAEFPVTIIDAIDKEVVIEAEPERIVSLIPSNTEISFALGLGEKVVGVSDFDNYPEEATAKEKIGGMEFNVEKIISLDPQLVLAHASSAHNSEAGLEQLRSAGIQVLVINDAKNLDDVYESITMVGTASGEKEKAEEIVAEMKEKFASIAEKAKSVEKKKSVYVEVGGAPELYAAGANTFLQELLELIGAENVITEEGWPKMDPEAVIERNPDVIITTYGYYTENVTDLVLNRDGWQDVTAIKNNEVYDVHSDKVTRTGPRLVEGVEELAKAVYPEVFN